MKKRSLLLVALVLFAASLFAAPVVVTWEWMLEDPNVTTFRYQVDGENPDGWIVVDSSVTSYTVKGLDGSKAYTLYLQQSYDGENFSGSAQAVSEPMVPAEPVVAEVVEPAIPEGQMVVAEAEPVVVAEPEPVVVAEPEPVVVAEPVVAEEKAKADSRFMKTITLGGNVSRLSATISNNVPAFNSINLEAELGLQLRNLMTFNETFGLGLDVSLAYTPYYSGSWSTAVKNIFTDFSGVMSDFTQAGTVSVAPMLNMQFGKVAINLGAGGFFTYGPNFISTKNEAFMYGAFAKVGLAYQFNSWFSMGANAKYNFVLSDLTNKPQFIEGGIYLGFSF